MNHCRHAVVYLAVYSLISSFPVSGQATVAAGVKGTLLSDKGGGGVPGRVRVARKTGGETPAATISTAGVGSFPSITPPALANIPVVSSGLAARATTAANGQFDITANLTGDFLVCVQPDDFDHLDPCKWGIPPQVQLTSSAKQDLGNIVMRRGVSLKVIIEDPTGLMGDAAEVGQGASVQVGHYYANGIFEPMRLESTAPLGKGSAFQFAVAIPPDVDLRLGVNSTRVTLTDESGGAVKLNTAAYAIRATSTESQRIVRFRVSGLLPGGR
ncbi:MAG: hypothetical protein ACKV2U_07880 [Bryobacteraceae bacterium]